LILVYDPNPALMTVYELETNVVIMNMIWNWAGIGDFDM
jgi:hypothetical protein